MGWLRSFGAVMGAAWRAFWGAGDGWYEEEETYAPRRRDDLADRVYLIIEVNLPRAVSTKVMAEVQERVHLEGEELVDILRAGDFMTDPRWPKGEYRLRFTVDTYQSDGECPSVGLIRSLIKEEKR